MMPIALAALIAVLYAGQLEGLASEWAEAARPWEQHSTLSPLLVAVRG